MREIKFRAWNGSKMFSLDEPAICNNLWMKLTGNPLKYIWMQYTGLKDKNGVEIYEGDIVKNDNWSSGPKCKNCGFKESESAVFQILWENISVSDTRNTSVARFAQKEIGGWDIYEFDESEYYEVIGNIYENPDLLT